MSITPEFVCVVRGRDPNFSVFCVEDTFLEITLMGPPFPRVFRSFNGPITLVHKSTRTGLPTFYVE